jgi:cyclic pyranopterin phosphate synthase
MLIDNHNRIISYLRISITDRCNFRCTYCLPADGVEWLPHDEVLSYEEIARVAQIGSTLGLSKIRITGGEPTVRKDLPQLITMLRAISGIQEISLTTNGARLGVLAAPLRAAGLDRVNISLDTLQREKMKTISRRDFFDDVMQGIEAAIQNDFAPLKFNCVAMRGVNDDEFCDLLNFANERGAQMRFIEYMPMGAARFSAQSKFISAEEMRKVLGTRFDLQPENRQSSDPAKIWKCAQTGACVGFITSISENFCDTCNRMRLTAEGGLRPCLHQNVEVGVKEILRSGGSDEQIAEAFREAANLKWAGHHMNDFVPVFSDKEMISIGG